MMKANYGIHWFRRDLRTTGNMALYKNWQLHNGRVLGLFCIDSKILARPDFSYNRFGFFLKTLRELQNEFRQKGGELLVVDDLPENVFKKIFENEKRPAHISFNRDYEPFARARDKTLTALFESSGVPWSSERDHLVLEPHEVVKDDGSFYRVFTPYSKRWFAKLHSPEGKNRISSAKAISVFLETGKLPFKDSLNAIEKLNQAKVTMPLPEAGHAAAMKQLRTFKKKLSSYPVDRDFPSASGTSGLSIFLKNGSLTTAQIISELGLERELSQYLKEIIWREFYYSILFHQPGVERGAFQEKYNALQWRADKKDFALWCKGLTGFPIVDAGMRQLNATGWMHNRVRMIVASFLTKDLLIHWRLGENYFMKMLLDGDLAPNNGGWQWAASTGCDPQPYFRIFNPWLQGAKFDPDAEYIKKYVPELKDISAKEIHKSDGVRGKKYPQPMVNHALRSREAIALFKKLP